MNTQPTPRTDAEHDRICELWGSTACDYDKMKDFSCQIERELAAVTAQRDEAREQANDMREKWLAKGQCCEYLGAELHEAIKQRDRLAEALEQIIEEDGVPMSMRASSSKSLAKQALQSLTPKSQ